jgi:hypothetical protein
MIQAHVNINNIDGLFDVQLAEVLEAVDQNLKEVANIVFASAKTSSGFRDKTGNLRGSIKLRKSKFDNGGYIVSARGAKDEKGYHAANVEFGHVMIAWGRVTGKRVEPHPFLRPAKEEGLRAAISMFRSKK